MEHRALFATVALVLAQPGAATALHSRYGDVSVHEVSGAEAKVEVDFKGRVVFSAPAESAELLKAEPVDAVDQVLVQLWSPGLNCHDSFAFLSIHADGSVSASPVFGECHAFGGIAALPAGAQVSLFPAEHAESEDEVWRYAGGKLEKLDALPHVKEGTPYAIARKQLLAQGWRLDASWGEGHAFRQYPEVRCSHRRDLLCNARVSREHVDVLVNIDQFSKQLPVNSFDLD